MTTLAANNLTIADAVRRQNATGMVADIGELLDQQNGMVSDIPWVEGDTPGGHMVTVRSSLPTFATRNANGSTTPTKSTTAQVLEAPEFIEAWSEMDELVARYGGDVGGKRASEAVAFAEAANQTVASRFIYGNGSTTVGQINGLAVRYNSSTGTNGDNVILGGALAGQTDCASIYLVGWGEGKVYGFYPKGTPGGLQIKDWGLQVVEDSTGRAAKYREQWQFGFGLALQDWRYAVRIANIDTSLLIAGTGADLINKMIQAIHCIPNLSACRPTFYMNRTVRMMLDIQARNAVQTGGQLSYEVVNGKRMEVFQGIPITLEDQLTEGETAIS